MKKATGKPLKKSDARKKELLHRIREALNPSEKTAYWLAKETGIAYNTIHRYLNNTMEPSLTNLKKIAHALKVPGKDLINF